jgi:hypothetical protein
MVGTLRSTDAAFTSTDGREASTHFGVGYGCGRAGHPTTAHVHQYVRLGDQAWGNGNWDLSGAWDDRYPTRLLNSRTVSIEHHDNGGRTRGGMTRTDGKPQAGEEPTATGRPASRHSGKPSSSRRARYPRRRSSPTPCGARAQNGPRQ